MMIRIDIQYIYTKIKIIINNENDLIKTLKSMFHNVYILKEITIKYKKCKVQNFRQMFHFCTKLESINFSLDDVCQQKCILCSGNVYH